MVKRKRALNYHRLSSTIMSRLTRAETPYKARFQRRILHASNRIAELNACKMRCLNQFNATHFNSMRVQSNIPLPIQSNIRLKIDSLFKRRILPVPNQIDNYVNKLCLLEWELSRRSQSAISLGKKMRRLNQMSQTYLFESTKLSIRRFNKPGVILKKIVSNDM